MIDIKKILVLKKRTDPAMKIPIEYHRNLKVFFRIKTNKLSKHRLYDLKIKLELEKQPPFNLLYEMFWNELKCLRKYLNEYFVKDFIRANTSSIITSVFFAKKLKNDL